MITTKSPLDMLRASVYGFDGSSYKGSEREFLEYLLRYTVKRACRHVPYYRKVSQRLKLSRRDFSKFTSPDLQRFPLVTKTDLVRRHSELIADDVRILTARYTSGTTRERTCIYVAAEEIDALILFNNLLMQNNKEYANYVQLRQVGPLSHGPDIPNYSMLTIPVSFDPGIPISVTNTIIEFRRKHLLGGKIVTPSSFAVPPRALRFLSGELAKRHIKPSSFGVKRILNYGNYCSQPYRKFCKAHWNSEVFDTYSLAEIHGTATECSNHGPKHFSPFLIAEVLDSFTRQPVTNGLEGVLTLTPMYPFQAAMPMLRYWTGDFVRATRERCKCGFKGVSLTKVLGRANYSVDFSKEIRESNPRVIAVTDVIDQIESMMPFVSKDKDLKVKKYPDLPPRFTMSAKHARNERIVRIELERFPGTDIKAMRRISSRIRDGLAFQYGDLNSSLRSRLQFGVRVARPGSIENPFLKT